MIVQSQEIRHIIAKAIGGIISPTVNPLLPDAEYYLPRLEEVQRIVKEDHTDRMAYMEEVFDCDDSAVLLKAAFIKDAYKRKRRAYAFGIVWGMFPHPHAVNWVITRDKEFFFIEPQTDEIYKPRKEDLSVFMIMG
jgi:hydroxymethylpyrimidine/phosphomethylpyrimidine kinase